MVPESRSEDTPNLGSVDLVDITVTDSPFRFRGTDDQRFQAAIVDAVNRMGGTGDEAEDAYARSLDAVRSRRDEVVAAVATEYEDLPEDRYLERWSLVYLVAELRYKGALGFFERLLASEIPDERSTDPHSFTTAGEEVMLRTTAVEGLERLAVDGDGDAIERLVEHLRHPNFSVRRACMQALSSVGDRDALERARRVLAEIGDERVLDIARIDVREAPQAEGGAYLVHPETRGQLPPHNLRRRED